MPSIASTCFNVSFHPELEEYNNYHQLFLDRIKAKYDRYIFTHEKGSKTYYNHLQGFIQLVKEVRADNFRNGFNKHIMKDMSLSHPKIALKIKPVKNDVKRCQAYPLKEVEDFDEVIYNGYELQYLLEIQEWYNSLASEKKVKIDRVRVSLKNIHIIIENRLSMFNIKPTDKASSPYHRYSEKQILNAFNECGNDGYYLLPILLRKDFNKVFRYVCDYVNKEIDVDDFLTRHEAGMFKGMLN